MSGILKHNLAVGSEIFVNILERGRGRDWLEDTKAQSMCLTWLVVRILADDDDLDAVD